MKKVKIGVMGCAAIARKSMIPAMLSLPEAFELVAVASRSEAKAAEFASEFNCKAVVGYDELLKEDIDAVYIPLPTGLHEEWINKALKAGKHVYAEKSIANSFDSAAEMVRRAKDRHLALMEGYMFLYHTQHQKVKELIADGAIGEIRNFRAAFGFPPLAEGNFRYDAEIGGGALYDAAGYPLRAVHFMLGNEYRVEAAVMHVDPNSKTNLYGSAFLQDASGVGAQIAFGFDHYYQCYYEIWGSKGRIVAERAFTPAADFSPTITLEQQGHSEKIVIPAYNHFIGAMQEFYDIIVGNASKESHYDAILLQSSSQQRIEDLSKT